MNWISRNLELSIHKCYFKKCKMYIFNRLQKKEAVLKTNLTVKYNNNNKLLIYLNCIEKPKYSIMKKWRTEVQQNTYCPSI